MSSVLEQLARVTYVTEHNPNCPSPYLVRLPGYSKGIIDKENVMVRTHDAYGYGKTLESAARQAFSMLKEQRTKALKQRAQAA